MLFGVGGLLPRIGATEGLGVHVLPVAAQIPGAVGLGSPPAQGAGEGVHPPQAAPGQPGPGDRRHPGGAPKKPVTPRHRRESVRMLMEQDAGPDRRRQNAQDPGRGGGVYTRVDPDPGRSKDAGGGHDPSSSGGLLKARGAGVSPIGQRPGIYRRGGAVVAGRPGDEDPLYRPGGPMAEHVRGGFQRRRGRFFAARFHGGRRGTPAGWHVEQRIEWMSFLLSLDRAVVSSALTSRCGSPGRGWQPPQDPRASRPIGEWHEMQDRPWWTDPSGSRGAGIPSGWQTAHRAAARSEPGRGPPAPDFARWHFTHVDRFSELERGRSSLC